MEEKTKYLIEYLVKEIPKIIEREEYGEIRIIFRGKKPYRIVDIRREKSILIHQALDKRNKRSNIK